MNFPSSTLLLGLLLEERTALGAAVVAYWDEARPESAIYETGPILTAASITPSIESHPYWKVSVCSVHRSLLASNDPTRHLGLKKKTTCTLNAKCASTHEAVDCGNMGKLDEDFGASGG